MASTPNVYAVCDLNCRWETMTKEQIITAIEQALETGTVGDVDAGFITKIKETNASGTLQFWIGTTAQYNAIETKDTSTIYILTDDSGAEDFDALAEKVNGLIDGSVTAAYSTNAANAAKVNDLEITRDENGVLKIGDTIIPQKKIVWQGKETITLLADEGSNNYIELSLTEGVDYTNKILEIEFSTDSTDETTDNSNKIFAKVRLANYSSTIVIYHDYNDGIYASADYIPNSNTLAIRFRRFEKKTLSSNIVAVYSISEIIE